MRKNEKEARRSMRDRVKAKANQPRVSKFDYLKLPEGVEKFAIDGKVKDVAGKKVVTMRFDIMPYEVGKGNPNCEPGEAYYERTYHVHKINLGNKNSITFICPKKTWGKKCPACEFLEKLRQDRNATKDEINNFVPKERQLFNVRDLADPDKTKVFDISYPLFGRLLDARIAGMDEDEDFDAFADLQGGKTIRAQFEQKKFNGGNYYEVQSIEFKDREEDYEDEVIKESVCLDNLLIERTYDEIKALVFESDVAVEDEDAEHVEEEDDEDEKPAKRTDTSRARKPTKEEVEEDDEEDTPPPRKKADVKKSSKPAPKEEDEDEDEPTPKPKKDLKKSKQADPEEDEDEDEIDAGPKHPSKSKKQPAKEEEDEDEDFDDEEDGKPPVKKAPVKKSSKKDDEDEESDEEEDGETCPKGHKWGIDCDADHCFEDCETCKKWDECVDAQEEMSKNKKGKR